MKPNDGNRAVLRAAIVGLGQVGSRFDEEPRPSIWSHAGAYLALPDDYLLVGGADPTEEQRARFGRRCPTARLFADPVAMVAEVQPHVLSVCTPPSGRAALVERLLDAWRPKVLICEKPLELDGDQRRQLVSRCAAAGVSLLVNYVRRYQSTYHRARQVIAEGQLGRIVSISVRAPNRLWSIGSHAVNLLAYLAGELPTSWSVMPLPALAETGEPAADALFRFESGAVGSLLTMGKRDVLIFEADVVGEQGRLMVTDNGDHVVVTLFETSPSFVGYRVPGVERTIAAGDPAQSPFVALIKEAAALAHGGGPIRSDGQTALGTESIVEAIIASCRREPI